MAGTHQQRVISTRASLPGVLRRFSVLSLSSFVCMASLVALCVARLIQPDLSVLAQQTLLPQGANSPQQALAENRSVQPPPPFSPQASIKFEDSPDRPGTHFKWRISD